MLGGPIGTVRSLLRNRSYLAIGLVTLLSLGAVGAVLLTTTSVGCSPANWLGVKATRCPTQPVAQLASASSPSPSSTPQSSPFNPGASSPFTPESSSTPPTNPGASSYPPYNPGSSGGVPITYPASGYPPMAYPGTDVDPLVKTLSCRLPLYTGGSGSGGFIVFPGATFVADPRSAVTVPPPSPSPTPVPGYGSGWYGSTYDATYSKWLPVDLNRVSPDGTHYAYTLDGTVYVQSVAGGAQLELGAGKQYWLIAVENDGVYVTSANQPGLWYLSFSGTEKQVTSSDFWHAESHGAAYGYSTAWLPSAGVTNTILKLDVSTGTISDFFTQQGGESEVSGFDGRGHPVVRVNYPGGAGLYIVTAANTSTYIAATAGGFGGFPQGSPVADSHGLWFSVTGGGIALYTNNAWYWMSRFGGQLAGACA